jgi:beta-catenin-like protein 1
LQGVKRKLHDIQPDDDGPAHKQAKIEEDDNGLDDIDLDDLQDNLDEETINKLLSRAKDVEALDVPGMKRLIASFERAITKNQQFRIKFAAEPEKFMTSEVDLYDEVKKLYPIAANPELYPEFIRIEAHISLLGLLTHENPDIVCDVIGLLKELTGTPEESREEQTVDLLVDALLSNKLLELMAQVLNRLDERQPDEKQGVYNTLEIIENLTEVDVAICKQIGEKTDIIKWILKRLQVKEFDDVKLYASEILSILVQNSKDNQILVGKLNGIDTLLSAVALYKKTNPGTIEEEELVENIFNCLCVVAVLQENRKFFTEAEGLRLLQILIKNKKYARKSSLKLLDFCLARDPDNCRRWVELPALGTLFAAFMKKNKSEKKKPKKGFSESEDDEHIISCLSSLFTCLRTDAALWGRVLEKFREEGMEKVERLLELHEKYSKKVDQANATIRRAIAERMAEGEEISEEDEDEFYLMRLDAGLFTLQLVDYVIAIICSADPKIKTTVKNLLSLQGSSFEDVKAILKGYADSIGTANSEEEAQKEKTYIQGLAADL